MGDVKVGKDRADPHRSRLIFVFVAETGLPSLGTSWRVVMAISAPSVKPPVKLPEVAMIFLLRHKCRPARQDLPVAGLDPQTLDRARGRVKGEPVIHAVDDHIGAGAREGGAIALSLSNPENPKSERGMSRARNAIRGIQGSVFVAGGLFGLEGHRVALIVAHGIPSRPGWLNPSSTSARSVRANPSRLNTITGISGNSACQSSRRVCSSPNR